MWEKTTALRRATVEQFNYKPMYDIQLDRQYEMDTFNMYFYEYFSVLYVSSTYRYVSFLQ